MARYHFDEDSFTAITAAGTDVVTVLSALHGRPTVRRHVGSDGLHVFAPTQYGRWLAMAFLETATADTWLLTRVRFLSAEEVKDVTTIQPEGQQ